jgi:hypothetical protein
MGCYEIWDNGFMGFMGYGMLRWYRIYPLLTSSTL